MPARVLQCGFGVPCAFIGLARHPMPAHLSCAGHPPGGGRRRDYGWPSAAGGCAWWRARAPSGADIPMITGPKPLPPRGMRAEGNLRLQRGLTWAGQRALCRQAGADHLLGDPAPGSRARTASLIARCRPRPPGDSIHARAGPGCCRLRTKPGPRPARPRAALAGKKPPPPSCRTAASCGGDALPCALPVNRAPFSRPARELGQHSVSGALRNP